VPCHLDADFEMATQHFHGSDPAFRWTHVCYFAYGVDIRDTWPAAPGNIVFVPQTAGGTPYAVVFVELVNRGTPQQFQRVFLQRQTPPWPQPSPPGI
jgi:hypothetical protein